MNRLILIAAALLTVSTVWAQEEKPQKKIVELTQLDFYAEQNKKLAPPAQGERRVVFMGNSITRGWVREHSAFFTENGYVGRGIGGQGTAQMLLRFQQDVIALKPYAVVINGGTNDIAENTGPYNPEFTFDNIRSMAQIAQANGIKVILSSVLPAGGFRWNKVVTDGAEKIVKLNKQIRKYAEENGLPYIDYHSAMKDKKDALKAEHSEDGVHPNRAAYSIMESVAKPIIDSVLAK